MHRRSRKNHRHPDPVFALSLIGQNDMPCTRANSILSLRPDAGQIIAEAAAFCGECAIDRDHVGVELLAQFFKLSVSDKRAV